MLASVYRARPSGVVADILLGLLVILLAIAVPNSVLAFGLQGAVTVVSAVLILAAAVAVRRLVPGFALAGAWVSSLLWVIRLNDVIPAQLGILIVLASAAHYGSRRTLVLSGVSVVAATLAALWYLIVIQSWVSGLLASDVDGLPPRAVTFGVLVGGVFAVPWLIGLLLRFVRLSRERRMQADAADAIAQRAQEVADVEAARVALARDVHDIVGHSLAVIVAQADSVRFRDAHDIEAVRASVDTIADTARRALHEVRQVLEETGPAPDTASDGLDLGRLIDDVAAARPGVTVSRASDDSLPPGEPGVALYRATQELLTNALRHGDSDAPIAVTVATDVDGMHVTVTNAIAPSASAASRSGTGLDGIAARLQAVGGALDVDRSDVLYAATARIPAARDRMNA